MNSSWLARSFARLNNFVIAPGGGANSIGSPQRGISTRQRHEDDDDTRTTNEQSTEWANTKRSVRLIMCTHFKRIALRTIAVMVVGNGMVTSVNGYKWRCGTCSLFLVLFIRLTCIHGLRTHLQHNRPRSFYSSSYLFVRSLSFSLSVWDHHTCVLRADGNERIRLLSLFSGWGPLQPII